MTEQAAESTTTPAKKHDIEKAARATCQHCQLSAPSPIVRLVAGVGYACGNQVACDKRQRKLVAGTVPTTTKRVKKPKGAT